jgi:hypothetical protein
MTDAAPLLALLHGSRRSYTTLRLTLREWAHQGRVSEALERRNRTSGGRQSQIIMSVIEDDEDAVPREPPSDEYETTTRLWIELPDRAREERTHRILGGDELHTRVIDGPLWWFHAPRQGTLTNEGETETSGSGMRDVGAGGLLEPSALLSVYQLEVTGSETVAGRAGIRVRCTRNAPSVLGSSVHAHELGGELEVVVDAERGILLRRTAMLDGEPMQISEVLEVAFDEQLDPALFVFASPDGTPARPLRQVMYSHRRVALHEAAADARIAVLAPERLPEGWELHARVFDEAERDQSVHLFIRSDDGSIQVNVNERPARGRLPESEQLRLVERDGITYGVYSGEDPPYRQMLVIFERDGTRAQLTSQQLDAERLLDLAAGFRVASSEPPSFS